MSTLTPESKKKKAALPFLLSNIRNAQAAVGRAVDTELYSNERHVETRPLVHNNRPQSQSQHQQQQQLYSNSSYTASSIASVFQNFSQRLESQWRKQRTSVTRRKKGKGVTLNIPQGFYIAVGCFFFAFPLFFVIYILARHAVFGDEDGYVKKHEVPASLLVTGGESDGVSTFESGVKELVDINVIEKVENTLMNNENVGDSDMAVDSEEQKVEDIVSSDIGQENEEKEVPTSNNESEPNNLQAEEATKSEMADGQTEEVIIEEDPPKDEANIDESIATTAKDITEIQNATVVETIDNIPPPQEEKDSPGQEKETGKDTEQIEEKEEVPVSSTSEQKVAEDKNLVPAETVDEEDTKKVQEGEEEKTSHGNLRRQR